jgi:hypothetical protein
VKKLSIKVVLSRFVRRSEPVGFLKDIDDDSILSNETKKLHDSFIGGPRYLYRLYRDSVTIFQKSKSKSFLFVTITMNVKDSVLLREIGSSRNALDQPVLAVRLFKLRIEDFVRLVRKEHIFGRPTCDMGILECQFRGYLHVHWIIGLEHELSEADVDRIISARVPNPDSEPELYRLVCSKMVHGPCNAGLTGGHCQSTRIGKCSKFFPCDYSQKTTVNSGGYPQYKRLSFEQGGFLARYDNPSFLFIL